MIMLGFVNSRTLSNRPARMVNIVKLKSVHKCALAYNDIFLYFMRRV